MAKSPPPQGSGAPDLRFQAAIAQQRLLASTVIAESAHGPIDIIAGTDVSYAKHSDTLVAAVALLKAETLDVLEVSLWQGRSDFPYIPGLFSFREVPPLLEAFKRLSRLPDLIVCDGQGLAHPRRFGLACHLGVTLDLPAIGCAKSLLIGMHATLGENRGDMADLLHNKERVGKAVRTRTGTRPVYVSVGHRVSLEAACDWVLRLSPRYRLPETTRVADHAVNTALKALNAPP